MAILAGGRKHLMRFGRFYSGAFWNLFGSALPMIVGLVTIPSLLGRLGVERFGLLNLSWLIVGYFSLFDLGLGRALTREVSERVALGKTDELPGIVGTSLWLMLVLGGLAGGLLAGVSPWIVKAMVIPIEAETEFLWSLWIMAGTLPFVVLSSGWRGVLEGYSRFDLVNWVRIPQGVLTFGAPLLALFFAPSLVSAVSALAVTRIFGWWFCRFLCIRSFPDAVSRRRLDQSKISRLLSFGGWLTLSNIVGPLMVYADRFLIGGLLSAAAVAYYATPYEIVSRLWIISGALTSVLYPVVAGMAAVDAKEARSLYEQSLVVLSLVLLPIVAGTYLFADLGLELWLGIPFVEHGSMVAKLLLIGVFVNGLGQVAITFLQASGRADWAAKLHLVELPAYLLLLVLLAKSFGIVGVAVAWLCRIAVDTIAMLWLVDLQMLRSHQFMNRLLIAAGLALALVALLDGFVSGAARVAAGGLFVLTCGIFLPRHLRALGQSTGRVSPI